MASHPIGAAVNKRNGYLSKPPFPKRVVSVRNIIQRGALPARERGLDFLANDILALVVAVLHRGTNSTTVGRAMRHCHRRN